METERARERDELETRARRDEEGVKRLGKKLHEAQARYRPSNLGRYSAGTSEICVFSVFR